MGKAIIGRLLRPLVIETEVDGEESVVVVPRNCIIEYSSEEEYPHDVTDEDIKEAAQLLNEID